MRLLTAALACLCTLSGVRGHMYFSAFADSNPDVPTTGQIHIYDRGDVVIWKLNITDAPPGLLEAGIIDRDPAGNLTLLALQLVSEETEGGELSFNGAFDFMPPGGPFAKVADLTEHMHIGHIQLQLTTVEGVTEGVFDDEADGDAYFTEEDEEMEWEGMGDAPSPTGDDHDHGDGAAHDHGDGAAHTHRRLLRMA